MCRRRVGMPAGLHASRISKILLASYRSKKTTRHFYFESFILYKQYLHLYTTNWKKRIKNHNHKAFYNDVKIYQPWFSFYFTFKHRNSRNLSFEIYFLLLFSLILLRFFQDPRPKVYSSHRLIKAAPFLIRVVLIL